MFETAYGHATRGAGDSTVREPRSGFSGFGGRPSLHPAWRDDDASESSAQVTTPMLALAQVEARRLFAAD